MEKMKSAHGYRAKNGFGMNEDELMMNQAFLVIKLPDTRVLRIMSRSLFLALLILTLPSLISLMNAPAASPDLAVEDFNGFGLLSALLRDLVDEGLIKKGHKGFVLGANVAEIDAHVEFLKSAGAELLAGEVTPDAHKAFDFVFAPSFSRIEHVDGILKEDGGLVISLLGHESFRQMSNYKIVYLRRFDSTVVAMRRTAGVLGSAKGRVLCGATPEEKKTALKGLEDVYLEPPHTKRKLKRSSYTSRKIKFLPELLRISLAAYPRRIFISDESTAIDWFYKNYPMREHDFEVYNVEARSELKKKNNGGETRVSNWLTKHANVEDYVVMKADAQVVEEMLKDKTLRLVDELFLECKNQWAYWQCLALYGKVRDEGIAVHQWWN